MYLNGNRQNTFTIGPPTTVLHVLVSMGQPAVQYPQSLVTMCWLGSTAVAHHGKWSSIVVQAVCTLKAKFESRLTIFGAPRVFTLPK
jgi:hypothetical protein